MNYNRQSSGTKIPTEYVYDTCSTLVLHDKIQYKRNQNIKYNFRDNLEEKDLNEGVIINFPYNNIYYSYKCKTTAIPLNRVFKRAGVIPYITTCVEGPMVPLSVAPTSFACLAPKVPTAPGNEIYKELESEIKVPVSKTSSKKSVIFYPKMPIIPDYLDAKKYNQKKGFFDRLLGKIL